MNKRKTVLLKKWGWSKEITSFNQSIASPAVTYDMESGDPPTGWTAGANTTLSAATDEHTGGAGSKSLKVLNKDGGANVYAVRDYDRGAGDTANKWYLYKAWLKNGDTTYGVSLTNSGNTFRIPDAVPYWVSTDWGLVGGFNRAGRYVSIKLPTSGATLNQYGLFDHIQLSRVTLNTQQNMPTADMQVDCEFTLPETTYVWQQFNLFYRVVTNLETGTNYFRIRLNRDRANTGWDIHLSKVVAGEETALIDDIGIGDIDAIRIKVVGNVHRLTTRNGSTWTQRGADKTDAANNTGKGVNILYDPGFIPTVLRGSRPLPFLSKSMYYFLHGDSKTVYTVDFHREFDYKFEYLAEGITGQGWDAMANIAVGGLTVINAQKTIDTDLAAINETPAPEFALINFGANDCKSLPNEATWKAAYLYILDAIHAKWPNAKLYIMRAWQRDYPDNCNTLATWIGAIVAARPTFVYLGPDERVFLENGDNGATYMADASHPNELGRDITATQWADLVL